MGLSGADVGSRWYVPHSRFLGLKLTLLMLTNSEIKMSVLTLILASTPELEGGQYTIVDKLNVTSVPPQGHFRLSPLTSGI
jgi:hypothetical protein